MSDRHESDEHFDVGFFVIAFCLVMTTAVGVGVVAWEVGLL